MHTLEIHQYEQREPRLGRHIVHDSRSKAYPISLAVPPKPVDVFHVDHAPILDQGNVGACVGFTGADFLNTDLALPVRNIQNGGKWYSNADGLKFYHMATVADGFPGTYPPDDTGSSGLGLAKGLRKAGLIKSYEHAFNWDHLVAGLAVQPLCMGTPWTHSMFTPDANGVITVGPINNSTLAGGHEWMLRGISYTKGLAVGRNHWNAKWDIGGDANSGLNKASGEFWITIADLKTLLANHGDVTRLVI